MRPCVPLLDFTRCSRHFAFGMHNIDLFGDGVSDTRNAVRFRVTGTARHGQGTRGREPNECRGGCTQPTTDSGATDGYLCGAVHRVGSLESCGRIPGRCPDRTAAVGQDNTAPPRLRYQLPLRPLGRARCSFGGPARTSQLPRNVFAAGDHGRNPARSELVALHQGKYRREPFRIGPVPSDKLAESLDFRNRVRVARGSGRDLAAPAAVQPRTPARTAIDAPVGKRGVAEEAVHDPFVQGHLEGLSARRVSRTRDSARPRHLALALQLRADVP